MPSNIDFNQLLIKYHKIKKEILIQSNILNMLSLNFLTVPYSTQIENNIFDLIKIDEKIKNIEKYTNIIYCEELENL